MKRHYYKQQGIKSIYIREEDEIPVCGQDFCDTCGDCLHCYGDLGCIGGGGHFWVKYIEEQGDGQ